MGTNKNKKIQLFSLAMLVFFAMPAAGVKWGVNKKGAEFYAGASAGGYVVTIDGFDNTNGGMLGALLGVEDRQWALEGKWLAFRTTEDVVDKTFNMSSIALAYRTPEKKGNYYKIKAGSLSDKSTGGTTDILIGLGYGWRQKSGSRIEFEYEISKRDATVDIFVHMFSVQYLFGNK